MPGAGKTVLLALWLRSGSTSCAGLAIHLGARLVVGFFQYNDENLTVTSTGADFMEDYNFVEGDWGAGRVGGFAGRFNSI